MIIRELGLIPYDTAWQRMQQFTADRTAQTPDEIWFCQHPPVFTQGRHSLEQPIINPTHIPVVKTDRGGQITYHGPGQLMVYCLIDLRLRKTGVSQLVCDLESAVINTLAHWNIIGHRREGMPGIYVNDDKICSLGLRVKRGCTYHGLALNVDMDLTPFTYIHPCGYHHLKMVQMREFVPEVERAEMMQHIKVIFQQSLVTRADNSATG